MSVGLIPPPNPAYTPGLQLLGVYSASAGASIDIVTRNQGGLSGPIFQSDFDDYQFEFQNIFPITNGSGLLMRMSTNGGSSYDSASNYRYALFFQVPTVNAQTGNDSTTSITICGSVSSDTTQGGCAGSFTLYDPLNAVAYKKLIGQSSGISTSNANVVSNQNIGAAYKSATPVNACQFLMSAGNVTGTILVYGKAKSAIVASSLVVVPGLVQLGIASPTGSVVTFSSIPGIYSALRIIGNVRCTAAGTGSTAVALTFNGDTGANYGNSYQGVSGSTTYQGQATGGTAAGGCAAPNAGTLANASSSFEIVIPNYAGSAFIKQVNGNFGSFSGSAAATALFCERDSGYWNNVAPITRVDLTLAAGNFTPGSLIVLYGML